jgi:glycosyltransferase involved in cell wall biosynthesis
MGGLQIVIETFMYLICIHIPIFKLGGDCFVTTEWKRSLVLLRDSIAAHFRGMTVLAPSLPAEFSQEQLLEPISAEDDGILPVPSFDLRCRAREYWLGPRSRWLAEARSWIARSQIVHAGLDDVYRPIMYDAFKEAARQGKPTVFVQDTDIAGRTLKLARGSPWTRKPPLHAYAFAYRRSVIAGVRKASLSLLKGSDLMRLYGPHARNAKEIQETSHLSHEIVQADLVKQRFRSLELGRSLRLVYCGRLIPRKGVGASIEVIAGAVRQGADVTFDIIGGGDETQDLQRQVERLGLRDRIAFAGRMSYGPELLRKLATYDALLFTPPLEDTPRMIFDGYAAGLPLIGWNINYIKERSNSEGATWLMPLEDVPGSVARLLDLARDRPRFWQLTEAALHAAEYHAADNWFRRRAEWTLDVMNRVSRKSSKESRPHDP